MPRSPSKRLRLAVLAASLAASAALVLALFEHRARQSARSVQLLDGEAGVAELLGARAGATEVPLEGWPPALVREELSPEVAGRFYLWNAKPGYSYEPVVGTRRDPHDSGHRFFREHPAGGWRWRTNSRGFRGGAEPAPTPPDLRVLVAGDSQTEGLCGDDETWASLLAARLREARPGESIEVWNAGMGGTNPYTYLGMLERHGPELSPDVFVAVFYGGNDLRAVMPMQRYFHRRASIPWREEREEVERRLAELPRGLLFADLWQPAYFHAAPEDAEVAVGIWAAIALEMRRRCDELGARLLLVYFPTPHDAQPDLFAGERARVRELLGDLELDLDQDERLADAWIALLAEHDLPVLDLRPALRAATEPLFWRSDYHLNLAGQRVVADALLPAFEAAD